MQVKGVVYSRSLRLEEMRCVREEKGTSGAGAAEDRALSRMAEERGMPLGASQPWVCDCGQAHLLQASVSLFLR